METGFFKWVWRFNALTIAIAATGLVIVFCVVLASEVRSLFGTRYAQEVVTIEDPATTEIRQTFQLGRFEPAGETGIMQAPLTMGQSYDQDYGFSSGSKSTYDNIVNMLFVDPQTGNSRWLIAEGQALVLHRETLARSIGAAEAQTTRTYGTLYRIVTRDTSGDKRLSESDQADLVITAPDGTGMRTLIADVTGLLQTYALDSATEMLVFRDATGTHMARLDLASGTVGARFDLPVPADSK